MDIKPIRTEEDYEAALKEIDRLRGTEPGTPDGDRFEVLFTLVEAYEEQHYVIPPPDPIEAIKYAMESRGLDRSDLEAYIGSNTFDLAYDAENRLVTVEKNDVLIAEFIYNGDGQRVVQTLNNVDTVFIGEYCH